MDEIKICTKPTITEYVDRWGVGTGDYYVSYVVGFISTITWNFIKEFQNYGNTPESIKEQKKVKEYLKENKDNNYEDVIKNIKVPLMKKLIDKANSQTIHQINVRLDKPDNEGDTQEYARVCAFFSRVEIYEHNSSFDEEYEKLKIEADRINAEAK